MKHRCKRFFSLLLAILLSFSLFSGTLFAEEEAESSEPLAENVEALPEANFTEAFESPIILEDILSESVSPHSAETEETVSALPAENTEQPVSSPLPESITEIASPLPSENATDTVSFSAPPSEELKIIAYPQLQGGMMLVGQEAVFAVVTEGDGSYDYTYSLMRINSTEDGSEKYFGSGTTSEVVYTAGPQGNIFCCTPEYMGVYRLQVTIRDTENGNSTERECFYICTTHSGTDITLGNYVDALILFCEQQGFTTQTEKAYFIHNFLTANAVYDNTHSSYFPDGVLLRGTGVCESYALAYQLLMVRMGIPCIYITGHTYEPHAWNLVYLDGHWWHVDVTWDDPAAETDPDPRSGMENNRYFYLEDEIMLADHSWDPEIYPACSGSSIAERAEPNTSALFPYGLYLTDENGTVYSRETIPGQKTVLLYSTTNYEGTEEILSNLNSLQPLLSKTDTRVVAAILDDRGAGDELFAAYRMKYPNVVFASGITERDMRFLCDEKLTYVIPSLVSVNENGIVTSLLSGASPQSAIEAVANAQITDLKELFSLTSVSGGVEITGYNGLYRGEIAFPEEIGGLPVTKLPASKGGSIGSLRWSLDAHGTLTLSGSGALAGVKNANSARDIYPWSGLENRIIRLRVEKGVTKLGEYSFYGCFALQEVQLPEGLQEISHFAFAGCTDLTGISLPETVRTVGQGAFQQTSLEQLYLPAAVSSFYANTLLECRNMRSVTVSEGSPFFSAVDGVLFNKNMTKLVYCPSQRSETLYIPASVRELDMAFSLGHCTRLTDIAADEKNPCMKVVGGMLCTIDGKTLLSCPGGMSGTVSVPQGVKTIGKWAFAYQKNLTAVELPEGIETIESDAFLYLARPISLIIPLSLQSIEDRAFSRTTVSDITYAGKEADWAGITVKAGNESLASAAFCYEAKTDYRWSEDHLSCTAFGVVKGENVTAAANVSFKETRKASCGAEGEITYTAVFPVSWAHTQILTVPVPKTAHDWGEVQYTWSEDHSTCTAKRVCRNDPTHTGSVTAKAVSETFPSTCHTEGKTVFTAAFTEEWCLKQTAESPIPKLEHSWVFDSTDRSAVPYYKILKCEFCGDTEKEMIPAPKSTVIDLDCGSAKTVYINDNPPFTITASVLPENAEQSVIWSGMKDAYGETVQEGNQLMLRSFTGKTGSLTLTATAADGSKVKASVKLTLAKRAESLNILSSKSQDIDSAVIKGKSSVSFKTDIASDKTVTDKAVIWSLSSEEYASVSTSGKVTVKSFAGEEQPVILTAATAADPTVSDSILLTLQPDLKQSIRILREGRLVTGSTLTVPLSEDTLKLDAEAVACEGDIAWKSSSPSVASADEDGTFHLLKAGTVTLTAGCGKIKSTVKLTVTQPMESLDITGPSSLLSGKSCTMKAVLTPAKPTDKTVLWTLAPGDEAYATLKSGKLTARKGITEPVDVTVIVSSKDGSVTARHTVKLMPPATSVIIREAPGGSVDLGEDIRLKAAALPITASQDIQWTSSNAKLFPIDADGCITVSPSAKAATVTFTAAALDGSGKKASVKIKFVRLLRDDELELKTDYVLGAGKTLQFKPIVTNSAVTDKKLTYSMAANPYATLKGDKLTAAKGLTAPVNIRILAVAADGSGVKRELTVTLYPAATAVNLYSGETKVNGKTLDFSDRLTLRVEIEPKTAAKLCEVTISSKAVNAEFRGGELLVFRTAQIKAGSKITVTVKAVDGSGKSAKITLKAVN